METQDFITIVVPTRNRSAFLRRLLRFFEATNLRWPIAIIDSSEPEEYQANQDVIADHPELRIEHRLSSEGMIQKCRRAVESIQTPYTVFCADDDFLMPSSVDRCVTFLEQNSDYFSATGPWVWFRPERQHRCHIAKCFSIEDEDPRKRMARLAGHWFPTFYCVYRTPGLARAWKCVDQSSDNEKARVFPETLLSQLGVLYGKLKVLPTLHLLFEVHGDNEHYRVPPVADLNACVELYERFAQAMCDELVQKAMISPADARSFVESQYGFWRRGYDPQLDRPTGWRRLRKNIHLQVGAIRDQIWRDPTNIRYGRRLNHHSTLARETQWQAALQLATQYPTGIPGSARVSSTAAAALSVA